MRRIGGGAGVTAPSIPHASNCADHKSVEEINVIVYTSAHGKTRRLRVSCPTCGQWREIERFEAFAEEEEEE
jgi:hypothetical protein